MRIKLPAHSSWGTHSAHVEHSRESAKNPQIPEMIYMSSKVERYGINIQNFLHLYSPDHNNTKKKIPFIVVSERISA